MKFFRSRRMTSNGPDLNAPLCGCKWFERAAKDDSIPVVFDERMNEYHLTHTDGNGHSLFYHCPFCGGKAPDSLRGTFWTEVSTSESQRLHLLTRDITSPEQLFAEFGQPDEDYLIGGGSTSPGGNGEPPETVVGPRRVVFKKLSETVDVHVEIDRYNRLRFHYTGRYVGPIENEA